MQKVAFCFFPGGFHLNMTFFKLLYLVKNFHKYLTSEELKITFCIKYKMQIYHNYNLNIMNEAQLSIVVESMKEVDYWGTSSEKDSFVTKIC